MKKHTKNSVASKPERLRKLSPWRVALALLLLAGIGYSSIFGWGWWKQTLALADQKPWFGSYVDVTSTPTYGFEQLDTNTHSSVVLSFIVSSKQNPCIPTWGAYFTLEEAGLELDLDRRIARYQQKDGKVAISFGGALNDELSYNCRNKDSLLQAYQSVIDRYQVDTIDLDLENRSLADKEAGKRRAEVIARLQQKLRSENKPLAIWLTVPVTPLGMTPEATDAIAVMLGSGVDIAGVNLMTMNYGESMSQYKTMAEASERALIESHRQLGILYENAGISLSRMSMWRKIGATPMLGQNDIFEEVFTLDDAKKLNEFALSRGIGRMSMWSANRDVPCSNNYVDLKIVSDSCSGVGSKTSAYAETLRQGFYGDVSQNSTIVTSDDPEAKEAIVDDPETSPYQIWDERGTYLKGVKVVWRGNVYEAKWWTRGDFPDNPVLQSWESPWEVIGPVLPGETPIPQTTLPEGTYPEWNITTVYQVSERVLYDGIPYEATAWNQGQNPTSSLTNPASSAWAPLSQDEIEELIK